MQLRRVVQADQPAVHRSAGGKLGHHRRDMAAGALQAAGRIEFREESDNHAPSLTSAARERKAELIAEHGQRNGPASVSARDGMLVSAPIHATMTHRDCLRSGVRRAAWLLGMACTLPAVYGFVVSSEFSAGQEPARREQLHGVISRARLSPPLRSPARQIRVSSNGSRVLVQNEAGVFVLGRDPLKLLLYVGAPDGLPARFTGDSKTLVIASHFLQVERWDISTGKKSDDKKLGAPDGCLAAQLSADGELAACYEPDFTLCVFRTAGGERIFSEHFGPTELPSRFMTLRGVGSPFPEPVGVTYVDSFKVMVGRAEFGVLLAFSPDGRYLLAEDSRGEALAVDIPARRKIGVPAAAKKRSATFGFMAPDRLAVISTEKPEDSQLISFPGGDTLSKLPVAGERAQVASDPRYAIVSQRASTGSVVLDLNTKEFFNIPSFGAADVFDGRVLSISEEGELSSSRVDQPEVSARFGLALDPLPALRTLSVSPGLESLAIGVRGANAIFRTGNGQIVKRIPRLAGSWWSGEEVVFLRSYPVEEISTTQKFDTKAGVESEAWRLELKRGSRLVPPSAYSSGPVVLQETPAVLFFKTRVGKTTVADMQGHYLLDTLDSGTGKTLWSRTSDREFPVPFPDPQGARIVLGWRAESEAAGSAVKRNPEAARRFKAAKLSEHDTVFEVLDALSGDSVGGVLVQSGAGPDSFSCAFSAGDALILGKDGTRVLLYSLSSGEERARLFGGCPSASAQTNLMAVSNAERVSLVDLRTGAKRDELVFPDPVVYTHFSADGKRLLVLTAHQVVFILDVSTAASEASAGKP